MSGFSFDGPTRAEVGAAPSPGAGDQPHHTPAMVADFRRTRPWVLFLAVLCVVVAAFALLAAVLFVGTAGYGAASQSAGMPKDAGGLLVLILGALFYGFAAAITAFFAVLLFRYAGAIGRVVARERAGEIEQALDAQRVFFKVFGIATIAGIALSIVSVVAVVVVGVAMAASGMQ
jgi:hypothetical protein